MTRRQELLRDHRKSTRNVHIGRVSIYRRAASWCIYYRENGKARRIRIGPDRKEAERRAAEVNAQLVHEIPSAYGYERVPVAELARLWLDHHELVLRSSVTTVRRYRAAAEHMLRFVREQHPKLMADGVSPRIAESFVKYLRRSKVAPNGKAKGKKRPLRDNTVVFILGVCRAMFNYAARQRHMPPYAPNPFTELGLRRIKVEDAKPTPILTPQEESAFLEACDPWQFRVFFTLAFTGMRPGELCHLLVEDVDLAGRLLHIRNHPDLGWKTKTRSERKVYLFDELLVVVRALAGGCAHGPLFLDRKFASGEERPPLGSKDVPSLIRKLHARVAAASEDIGEDVTRDMAERIAIRFWTDMGATTPKQVRREFIRVAKKIGRPDLTCPKLWRHQMATAMQSADVDPFVRREVIGHTRLETTRLYTHTRDDTLSAQMTKVLRMRGDALALARRRTAVS